MRCFCFQQDVLNNYIPHEIIMCDDKDPSQFNSRIKCLIENKNKLCQNYQRFESNSHLLSKLNLLQELINKLKTKLLRKNSEQND